MTKMACEKVQSDLFCSPVPPPPPRPDDSAVWVDQQEWGAAGQKSVPPGHGSGGLGHPGALPGRAGCAVSSLLPPNSFQVCRQCSWHQLRTLPRSLVKSLFFVVSFVFNSVQSCVHMHSCLHYAPWFCSIFFWTGPRDSVIVVSVEGHIVLFCDEWGKSGRALEKAS